MGSKRGRADDDAGGSGATTGAAPDARVRLAAAHRRNLNLKFLEDLGRKIRANPHGVFEKEAADYCKYSRTIRVRRIPSAFLRRRRRHRRRQPCAVAHSHRPPCVRNFPLPSASVDRSSCARLRCLLSPFQYSPPPAPLRSTRPNRGLYKRTLVVPYRRCEPTRGRGSTCEAPRVVRL